MKETTNEEVSVLASQREEEEEEERLEEDEEESEGEERVVIIPHHQVVLEGPLELLKRGKKGRLRSKTETWQKRYYRLKYKELAMYRNKTNTLTILPMSLHGCIVRKEDEKAFPSKPFVFSVASADGHNVAHLAASSEEERSEWVDTIQLVIDQPEDEEHAENELGKPDESQPEEASSSSNNKGSFIGKAKSTLVRQGSRIAKLTQSS